MAVVGESVSVHEDCHAHLAEAFGMLAAIESESWQFTHPQEFAALKSKFKHMLAADRSWRTKDSMRTHHRLDSDL